MAAGELDTSRRRPKNRKAQIVRVAARAFSDRGYHPVGVDEIAAEIGISGPALYRHFPNKYALFVAAAESCPTILLAAANSGADDLDAVLSAIIDTSIENRRSSGLYRWERRYLAGPDRKRLRGIYDEVTDRIADPLAQLRPELSDADRIFLANATLSVLGSLAGHRTVLGQARLHALIADMCEAVLWCELPGPAAELGATPDIQSSHEPPRGVPLTSKRERLLAEAIRIIGSQGYHDAGIDEIAAAAGVNPSSIYRYFPSKADLLAAAFHRAGDRVSLAITEALAAAGGPAEALSRVAERYIQLSFANPELFPVYFAEQGNLPAAEQASLRGLQRQNVQEWVHLLTQLGTAPIEARFRAHAALALVLDVGRLVHFDPRPAARARVHLLMMAVLEGGRPRPPSSTVDATLT